MGLFPTGRNVGRRGTVPYTHISENYRRLSEYRNRGWPRIACARGAAASLLGKHGVRSNLPALASRSLLPYGASVSMKISKSARGQLLLDARRIVVVGAPGSGKSTMARHLHSILHRPLYHLDDIYWLPGWRRVSVETFSSMQREIAAAITSTRCLFGWYVPTQSAS